MPLRAKIAGALLVCTILSACQSSGSGGSNGLSTTPTSGPANPVGLQQCQAITASPATTTTIASPTAPPVSGDTQASLVLVPEGAHSLGVYLRNPWTGALIDRGYVATGQTPSAVAVSGGQFVYVANTTDGTISAYSWQPSQAQLAALGLGGTNTISSGPGVSSLAVVGHYLYALNTGDSSITTFSIDSGNGALTLVNTIGTPALTTLAPGTNGLLYGIGNTEIVTYSAGSGSPATMWTTTGLTGILTAAANSVGNLYVLTNTSVEAFSPAGNGRLGSQDRVGLPDGLTPAAITAGNGQVNVVGDGSNT